MENLLGEIGLFPYNFAPRGWMNCDGRLLDISQHQSLFSLLGTNYGGDGRRTFGLPKLSSPIVMDGAEEKPLGFYCICIDGIYPSRS